MSITPPALPASYAFGYVVGQVIHAIADQTGDADRNPESRPATGTIRFEPLDRLRKVTTQPAAFVVHEVVACTIGPTGELLDADGQVGVWLVTGGYRVSFVLDGGATIPSFDIEVTSAHTLATPLDLATVAPYVPPSGTATTTLVVPSGATEGQVLAWTSGALGWTTAEALTMSIAVTPDPAAPVAAPSATYLGAAYSVSDQSSYTLTVPLGAPSETRTIVAVVTAIKSPPAAQIASATIAGAAATIDIQTDTAEGGTSAAIIRATVPAGTSGDLVVTYTSTVLRCHVAVWSVDLPVLPIDTGTARAGLTGATLSPSTVTLDVDADDIVISGAHGSGGSGTTSWSGVTKRYDWTTTDTSIMTVSGGHRQVDLTGSHAVTRTPDTAIGYVAQVAAAYRAA